ncbi:cellulose synthase subunit BcsC-related outer membrane protein [Yersinia aleksiciae]|uniref:cellulose synthase subunit BcsC-related outer membrane protein n=1 Tax=Yersinia aleksiciae TaxID=263819 RepID=UPI0011A752F4|nr:cellulose synthase subunit BcsC-related outer membrane protein [Yersinia aleksiciae]
MLLLLFPIAILIIVTPMDSNKQYIFGIFSIAAFFLLGLSKSRKVTIVMTALSFLMSSRYIYWRTTETLHFGSVTETILDILLYTAELYILVILSFSYLQTIWPLKRSIEPLPEDTSLWPTVDVYIPTYNESLDVVLDTILAAQCIDYPKLQAQLEQYVRDGYSTESRYAAQSKNGIGYNFKADGSYNLQQNIQIGSQVGYDTFGDYSETTALIYFRYLLDGK